MKNHFGKNKILFVAVFLLIVIAAVFLRTYHFDDWLYFKMDQSRDALLTNKAVENGPGYLPLLGARAGATDLKHGFLRLGPIFYYFQYASAIIFHSTQPYVLAYPDLFFSILAIPMLFLLLRIYFSRKISLMVMAMYAFSFIIIQYSRFSWNPNSLQFFLLLTFYGLLKFLNEQNEKYKKWWIMLWAIGITVGSQLHFFGFFSLIGISCLLFFFHYQFWKKEKISGYLKKDAFKKFAAYAGVVLIVFAVFYMPVIISDSKENWQNSKNFIEALSAKPEKRPLMEKISKAVTENANYYCLITTSQCYGADTKKETTAVGITVLILLAGFILAIRKLRSETDPARRDFLSLLLVWFGVFSVLTIPVSFQLRPRFFIVVFAVPFIFLGLIYEYLKEKLRYKQALALALLITFAVVGWNCYGTYAWFKEQAKSQESNFTVKRTLILKNKDGVTLGQLQRVADWIYQRHQAGKNFYYYIKPEHVRPIDYLLTEKHDIGLRFFSMKINEDPNAQFFAVTPAKNGLDPVTKKFGLNVTVIASEKVGQLMVYEIDFPDRIKSDNFKLKEESSVEDRLFWKDVLKSWTDKGK
jgi:hypothetical protein